MKRRAFLGLLAALILACLTACGGGGGSNGSSASSAPAAPSPESPADMAYPSGGEMDFGAAEYEFQESVSADSGSGALRDAKMILTADLELETTAFEESTEGLRRLTEELEGYFETTSIRGSGGSRWANYTIRVPAKHYDAFLQRAGELCHLTWQVTGQENITEAYYDTEGRLKTQQIKLERLQELLAKAENMEDIITIESAISETEYQIESLSGTLRHYDALVDFATVNVNLQEVYKLSSVEEAPDSFGARLGSAFSNGWTAFTDWLEDLAVGLAYSWMWLIVLAVVIFVVVRVVRRKKGKLHLPTRKKKDDNPPET